MLIINTCQSLLFFALNVFYCCASLSGHMKLLGEHNPPESTIAITDNLDPSSFYRDFVMKNKPILFKNLMASTMPLRLWKDDYLHKQFNNEMVNVDFQKYENRSGFSEEMPLSSFLNSYNKGTNMYLVSSLPHAMQKEFPVPHCLLCKELLNRMQDFVLWFSSGHTNSHLHYDNVENLYCQLDGIKNWFIVDPYNGSLHIKMDHPEGHYSSVNVTAVDMHKYPGMQNIPWWNASTTPGDCLYMPLNWWHQVRSENGRNMAVNIWWAPQLNQRKTSADFSLDCEQINQDRVLSDLNFVPGEWIRWSLVMFLQELNGKADFSAMRRSILHEHSGVPLISESSFKILDTNSDGAVDINELLLLPPEIVHGAVDFCEIGALNTNGHFKNEDRARTLLDEF